MFACFLHIKCRYLITSTSQLEQCQHFIQVKPPSRHPMSQLLCVRFMVWGHMSILLGPFEKVYKLELFFESLSTTIGLATTEFLTNTTIHNEAHQHVYISCHPPLLCQCSAHCFLWYRVRQSPTIFVDGRMFRWAQRPHDPWLLHSWIFTQLPKRRRSPCSHGLELPRLWDLLVRQIHRC